MTSRPDSDARGGTSDKFDRVRRPDPVRRAKRDAHAGKEALYSTAPAAPPSSQLLVICSRCDVESGINLWDARKIFAPPFLVANPLSGRVFGRCPACEHRAWLRIRTGQALRALFHLDDRGRRGA